MALPTRTEFEDAAALVHSILTPTPEIAWPLLAKRIGCEVWVKHENHTPVGAFKVRGGLVYLDDLQKHGQINGVIAATRGNHGQSVAYAGARLGIATTVVVPEGNAAGKNAAMQALGAELVVHGVDFEAAFEHAQDRAAADGLIFVPSFDMRLARGVGTYALELFTAVPDLNAVYVPIGLGSGICGLMGVRDALGLKTEIIGVVAAGAPCYALTFEAKRPISTNTSDTVVGDGIATRIPSALDAVEEVLAGCARVLTVTDDEMLDAMAAYYADTHNLAEGAGAAPLAALMQERDKMAGKKVGVILTGANVDPHIFARALARLDDRTGTTHADPIRRDLS
jgi:threonine dehydratase